MEFRDEYVPLSTTKFGWSVKFKSIQDVEVGGRWEGSDMNWWKPCKDVRVSRRVLSAVVSSFFCLKEDLALKSPKIVVEREFDDAVVFEMSLKFDKYSLKSMSFWVGDQ